MSPAPQIGETLPLLTYYSCVVAHVCGPRHVEVDKVLENLQMLPQVERCQTQRKINDTTHFTGQGQPSKELCSDISPLVVIHVLATFKFAHLAASFEVGKAECDLFRAIEEVNAVQ